MAKVTFTTTLGTAIEISNLQSNSSFEILKGAVALIEGLELAEQQGNAAQVLAEGMSSDVGGTSGLILTSRPQDVRMISEEQSAAAEDTAGTLGYYCGNPDCPVHGYQVGIQDDQTIGQVIADALGLTDEELDEDDDYAEIIQMIADAYSDVEEMVDEFMESIPQSLQLALPEIEAFSIELRDYADHLDPENPAAATIFAIGAGIQLGAIWAGISEGLPTPAVLAAQEAA